MLCKFIYKMTKFRYNTIVHTVAPSLSLWKRHFTARFFFVHAKNSQNVLCFPWKFYVGLFIYF